ncbi:MAG: sensor histidine kinase [Christensenellales bacterium]|jgi:signal transduction histidine kinase
MTQFLGNKEVRRLIGLMAALCIVMGVIGLLAVHLLSVSQTERLAQRDLAIVGSLSRGAPMKDNPILTGTIDPEDVAAGQAALAPYSYTDVAADTYGFYGLLRGGQSRLFLIWGGALALGCLALCAGFLVKVYADLRRIARTAADMGEGRQVTLPKMADGDLGALAMSLERILARLNHAKEALAKDKADMQDLLGDISHQLKTPLAAVGMYVEILLTRPELPREQQAQFLALAQQQIDRSDFLVQGLLKMARMDAGAIRMRLEPTPLAETAEAAAAPFILLARERGVDLQLAVPEELTLAHDGQWMAEAVGNLVKNALEHTRAGDRVTVAAHATPLTVTLSVTDTGSGIAPSELPHIFERFYRSGSQVDPKSVGIGLALAKQIVEKNGGQISVKSQPGRGTTFLMTFLAEP